MPGTDGAGRVAAVGAGVRRFRAGDRVYSYSYSNRKGGFHAQQVVVDAKKVARVPRGLGLKEAGAIATTGLTALQGVDDALRVKRGERVIVHGASGGVGSLAMQFAKWRGAHVFATASAWRAVWAPTSRWTASARTCGRRRAALHPPESTPCSRSWAASRSPDASTR